MKGVELAATGPDTGEQMAATGSARADVEHAGAEAEPRSDSATQEGSRTVSAQALRRWWFGVLIGLVVSAPLSWLLSHAATLPFFIGLFFFPLFGLVIGACIFRYASGRGPFPPSHVIAGTTLIVLPCWGASLYLEAARFPRDVAEFAAEHAFDLGGRDLPVYLEDVAEKIDAYLARSYPPGGTIGYARWSILDGRIARDEIPELLKPFRSNQARIWWAVRVVISIGLLAFGVGSQTLSLARQSSRTRDASGESAPGGSGAP